MLRRLSGNHVEPSRYHVQAESRHKQQQQQQRINDALKFQVRTLLPESQFSFEDEDEPPTYDDPSHPWMTIQQQQPAQEEEEVLPAYECTVSRLGHVLVKTEKIRPHVESKKRSWKKLYVVLWGTYLRAYKREPKKKEAQDDEAVWNYSMQGAEAGLAVDYTKHAHTIRVKIDQGPQFLFRCASVTDSVLWIDAIQASANVSSDLDVRTMPEFSFHRQRQRRQRA